VKENVTCGRAVLDPVAASDLEKELGTDVTLKSKLLRPLPPTKLLIIL
jgi:hypothetical protein